MTPKQIVYYQTENGFKPFLHWYQNLSARSAIARIMVRLDRASEGNFGDFRNIGMGISEMRIHWGPGYRIYFALEGIQRAVFLLGGDKTRQQNDVRKAQEYWQDYLRRKK